MLLQLETKCEKSFFKTSCVRVWCVGPEWLFVLQPDRDGGALLILSNSPVLWLTQGLFNGYMMSRSVHHETLDSHH